MLQQCFASLGCSGNKVRIFPLQFPHLALLLAETGGCHLPSDLVLRLMQHEIMPAEAKPDVQQTLAKPMTAALQMESENSFVLVFMEHMADSPSFFSFKWNKIK